MKKRTPEELRRALKERDEALAFQAATDEILAAISRSPSDARPVFDAIVRSVPRLFRTRYVSVFLVEGDQLHLAAAKADARFEKQRAAVFRRFRDSFPQPIDWRGFTGSALRSGRVSQIAPIIGNPKATPQAVQLAKEFGYDSMLIAPLVRDGKTIGAIGTTRPEAKLFDARELALFKRFAAQAVIAIENARRFNETKEALERQTATAEILKVISASPTSTQPVFESIVNNCGVLFKDCRVALWQIGEGRLLPRASTGYMPEPMPLDRESAIGACVLEARTIHFADLRSGAEQHPRIKQLGLKHGYLSGVYAPLLRDGQAIGAISLLRRELGAFSDKEVALLGTFADQAVIAIENARLFNETKEALEQQTTTAGVLRVIAGSPTDLKPVMTAVVERAARLLEADHALIGQSDGENIHWLAAYGCPVPDGARSITRELPSGRAILDLQTTQIEDIGQIERDSLLERSYGRFGVRTICATPLIREGRAVGVILLRRTQVRPFTEKQMSLLRTFADQAVIAIENARLFNETKEALEHQTASADILRIVAGSVDSTDPVFKAITEAGMRFVPGCRVALHLLRDGHLHYVSHSGVAAEHWKNISKFYPLPVGSAVPSGEAVSKKRIVHVPDIERAGRDFPLGREIARVSGWRSILSVPLIRGGDAIGNIAITRPEPGPFTDKQIRLLQTFADQAVIAIENARLFNETKEALERQTATGEILRVMSSSPSDIQPVFDTIARNASRLCNGNYAIVTRFDGELIHLVAEHNPRPGASAPTAHNYPRPPGRELPAARAIVDRAMVHIPNAEQDAGLSRKFIDSIGARSFLAVPMLREGEPIGAIGVSRVEPSPFPENQIELVKLFADQAVIAIENVRLFNETREALEQQKAMSEILRTISSSPTDLQPVFDTILDHAIRLGEGSNAALWRYEDGKLRFAAEKNCTPEGIGKVKDTPLELGAYNPTPQAGLERRTVHVLNVFEQPQYRPLVPLTPDSKGNAAPTVLAVPLLKDDELLGVVSIWRREPRLFTGKQVAMVETFAAQAVIAIENVRLFNETREALERQTATSEVLRVISGTPADPQPVFEAIAQSAARVFNAPHTGVFLVEGGLLRFKATAGQVDPRRLPLIPFDRTSASGLALLEKRTVDVPDTEAAGAPPFVRDSGRAVGFRATASAPMLRDGKGIGTITVMRAQPGALTDKQRQLLQTFADQAAIAIENARLFNETKEALERQTATAEILRVISGTPTDTQPVFEAIVQSAQRLMSGRSAALILRRESEFFVAAFSATGLEQAPADVRTAPLDREKNFPSRVILDGEVVHIPDWEADDVPEHERAVARALGFASGVQVPLLREGHGIGALVVTRQAKGSFQEKEIALLRSFADQAVIAIENVRLFNETKQALERQTATGEILSSISSSVADVQPVFDAIVRSLCKLFGTRYAVLALLEGDRVELKALAGDEGFTARLKAAYPYPATDEGRIGVKAMQLGRVVQLSPIVGNPEAPPKSAELARLNKYNSIIVSPLMREGSAIGYIITARGEATAFDEKQVQLIRSFADQAVIAIQNARLFNETKEALEQQTAMAEVLQVISASMADTAPVFDKILQSCKRLFSSAEHGILLVADDGRVRIAAHHGSAGERVTELVAAGLADGLVQVEAIRQRKALHFVDALADEARGPVQRVAQRLGIGSYSQVVAPMLWEDQPVGWLYAIRQPATGFKESEIALLKAFADQAVIAIQNSRLFNETKEALERQTATGEILASMSGSMTDTKPVFDAIVRNLLRLFGSGYAVVSLRRGEFFELAGHEGEPGFERLKEFYPIPIDEHSILGEVVLTRQVRKYAPVVDNPAVPRQTAEIAQRFGFNSIMAAPMMWKGEAIGAIVAARRQPQPFDDKQVALIQSFADQAVIAIENVRLFKELQERTEALTKSVGQLTALGEVGRAISSTLELEQVLKTIVQRAVQLAGLDGGSIYEFEARDERFHLRAAENIAQEILNVSRRSAIRLGEGAVGRAGATREPVVVEDVLDERYQSRVRELLIKSGARALLAVPLLREDLLLGALVVSRNSPGPFAPEVVELLKTFATQSAVAIQNAHLFREIEEKSRQLEEASRHKSQFLASMSHELRTPLNAILGFNEMILGQVYGEVPSDMKEPLEDIQKSGKHLLRLINNVLDLAKIEAGRMELALADYSVQDTVESVRSTLRPLAEAKGIELVASVPEDIPLAYGDGGRLTQCLMNLAGNSLKFTKQGKVEIAVEADNGCLRWRVSDTGIGIPPDKIPTLFSEFKQTDATIASEYGGTGLGLSITKKFVEMHGGHIWVESELGKGSVFTLEIPLRVTAPA